MDRRTKIGMDEIRKMAADRFPDDIDTQNKWVNGYVDAVTHAGIVIVEKIDSCLECGHCERYMALGKEERMRCWSAPDVCDHALSQSIEEAKHFTCENFITPEALERQRYAKDLSDFHEHLRQITKLIEKHPELKWTRELEDLVKPQRKKKR